MSGRFRCNQCWQPIKQDSHVTACSHIFCAKCAQGWFAKSSECPCCRKVVDRERLKHVRADLNPGEAAMMLWGLTPQQIMEITKSAIGFFDYQKKQEVAWLMHQIGVREKKLHQCQNQFKAQFVEMKNRFNTLKVARESDRSEFKRAKEAYKTLHENYQDKCRQLRKFEQLYNNLRQSQDGGGQPLNAFSPSSVPGANEVFAVPSSTPSHIQHHRERRSSGGGVAGAPVSSSGMMTPPSPSSVASLSPAHRMRAPSSSMRRSSAGSSSFRAPLQSPRTSSSGVGHNPFRTPRGIRAGGMPSSSRGSSSRSGSGGSISRAHTPGGGGGSGGGGSGGMSMSSLGVTPRRRRRKHSAGALGGTPGTATPSLSSMFKRRNRR